MHLWGIAIAESAIHANQKTDILAHGCQLPRGGTGTDLNTGALVPPPSISV